MRTRKRAKGTVLAHEDTGHLVGFTPIEAPRGQVVHATSFRVPTHTACGKKFAGRGWRISLKRLDCVGCSDELAVGAGGRRSRKNRISKLPRALRGRR